MDKNKIEVNEETQLLIEKVQNTFMPELVNKTEAVNIYPGIAVSFSANQFNKEHLNSRSKLEGYYTVVPTKASHALYLALDVLRAAIDLSERNGTIRRKSEYLQEILDGRFIAYNPNHTNTFANFLSL